MAGKTIVVKNFEEDEVATYENAKIEIDSGMLYVKDADDGEVLWVSTMSRHSASVKAKA